MTIQGLRDTTNFVTDERPKNWREGILLLYPNGSAPLTALTSVMKKRTVDDPEYNWWDKGLQDRRVVLTADPSTTSPLTAAAGEWDQFKAGDMLYIEETGEICLITTDPTVGGTTVAVTRSWGSVAATAVNPATSGVNGFVFCIGSVNEEGSDAPTGVNFDPVKRNNYTQIFRNTLEITRTASRTRLRTKDAVKEARRECLEYHSVDMEKAFWFGEAVESTVNSKPARSTGGVTSFIDSTNIIDHAGASTTLVDIEDWMEQAFRFGSQQKMAFTGNIGMLQIQRAIRKNTTYQFHTGEKEFGMNVNKLVSPYGELILKTHPLFNQIRGGTNTTEFWSINSWLYILDMQEFTYVPLAGGDTQYQQKLQGNGLDSIKSGYLTEAGLEVHHPLSHMLIKNLGDGSVDA